MNQKPKTISKGKIIALAVVVTISAVIFLSVTSSITNSFNSMNAPAPK